MANFTHLPDAEYRNDSWTLAGSGVERLFDAWNNDDDTKYAKCPNYKGRAAVMFPTNVTTLPAGANITSVSVYVRAAKTVSSSKALTINLLSTDKASCFSTRTLYLSETITTYEVGTYTRDVLNKVWTISRLNKLVAQLYVYGSTADHVRVYKCYVVVNYSTHPTVSVTAPTGTQVTASPTISWTYTQVDGDLQKTANYKIFTEEETKKTTFNPAISPSVLSGTVQGDQTSYAITGTLPRGTYYAYVKVTSVFGAASNWAGRLFAVQPQLPGIPYLTASGDSATSKAELELVNATNLLSLQQSSAERLQDGPEYVVTGCTLAATSAVAYGDGTSAYSLTASGAGTKTITSSFIPVAEDTAITARMQVQSAASARSATLTLTYYDATHTSTGTPLTQVATTVVGGWSEYSVTGTTPTGCGYVKLSLSLASVADTEVHYIDGAGVMFGTNTVWSIGGHFSRNLLSTAYSSHPVAADWTAASGTGLSNRTDVTEANGDGPNAMRMTAVTVPTSISWRATGTVFTSNSNLNTFTLNKPAGTAEGDLMIAVLTSTDAGVLYPPTGWTYVNTAAQDTPDVDTGLWILSRIATASEPSTWACTVSDPATGRRAVVVSYIGASATQFIAENVKTHYGAPTTVTTQTVTNTDPNAWQLSVFSARDNTTGSWSGATTGLPGTTSKISYVGAASAWRSTSSNSSFQINRPPNVISGDLMIATVGFRGTVSTIDSPSGWTKVKHTTSTDSFPTTMAVFTRTAGGSEPASWTATTSSVSESDRVSQCVAYRGAADAALQFVAHDSAASTSGQNTNKSSTPFVTNTDGRSWSVAMFACNAEDYGSWDESNESRRRVTDTIEHPSGTHAMTVGVFDSNGTIGTGSHKRYAYWDNDRYYSGYGPWAFSSTVAWIGIIKVTSSAPVSGTAQTELNDGASGTGSHNITTMICHSAGVVPVGDKAITATYNQSTPENVVTWTGIIRPATTVDSGLVQATMTTGVDVSYINAEVLEQAQNRITMMADFLGNVPGTSYLTMKFYEANRLLSTMTAEAGTYIPGLWTPSRVTFDLPDGTTSIIGAVSSNNRAIDDTVDIDRVSIQFGEPTRWRAGTSEITTHSVWSRAAIQYADDLNDDQGYGPWKTLYGTVSNPPIYSPETGRVTYTDHTPIPLATRKYRVATLSYGLGGDYFQSGWSEESNEVTITPTQWWLKDPTDPDNNMPLYVRADTLEIQTSNTANVFQPLGSEFPVVLTEGFKADRFSLSLRMDRADWRQFKFLARQSRTLYIQSDCDDAWWVRIADDLGTSTVITYDRQNNPIRWMDVAFVQVAPEE